MNILLWVFQGLLAAFFIMPGFTKVITPKTSLVEKGMAKASEPIAPVRIIGIFEILGVIGIILPWLLQVYAILTPLAAAGFAIVMIGAFAVHFNKKDYKILPVLALVFIISAVVCWFRFQSLRH